jgi:MoaE-MoaD fusion protein
MRVHVLFFGLLKELAGKPAEEIDVRDGASVREVLERYESRIPQWKTSLSSIAVAVNQQYAGPDTKLQANDEIALLPPVSGGLGAAGETPAGPPVPSRAAIVRGPIDACRVVENLRRGQDGASLVFEGVVRNQTRGRRTVYLDYEAYEQMALREMESLAARALAQFPIRDVAIVHRLGRLHIAETSVVIAVASAHRAAAFDACRWLIDTLKTTVPIWKKEYFEDGAVWADGEPFPADIPRANS